MLNGWTVSSFARFGLLVAVTTILVDQGTKLFFHYVIELPSVRHIPVLPFFSFTHVWNEGVSFGLFQAQSFWGWLVLLTFQLAVSAFIARWLWMADRMILAVGLGLVLGGALGNVIDRAIFGKVFDFLDFSGLGFPWVFNLADASIQIGAAVLVYDAFFAKRDKQTSPPNETHQ